LVTTWLINTGRGRYAWVTLLPMLFVITTTMTAGVQLITKQFPAMIAQGGSRALAGYLNIALTLFVMLCVIVLLLNAAIRWVTVWLSGEVPGTARAGVASAPDPTPASES
jgi:carbon starvation protein